jgi:thiol-disulfide isomerase/thioredoxin
MKATYVYVALIIGLIVLLVVARNASEPTVKVTAMDPFAQCLTDAGAVFYGAFWCPHCQEQKEMLQDSVNIPYVECSTADMRGQTPRCIEAGITGYPTWVFADGSIGNGRLTLEELASRTNCTLPETTS